MNEWDELEWPRRATRARAIGASAALLVCVGVGGWLTWARVAADGRDEAGVELAEADGQRNGVAPLRGGAVASAAPPGSSVTLGTSLEYGGALPMLSVRDQEVRWPRAEGEEPIRTALPALRGPSDAADLAVRRAQRFEASAVHAVCGGKVPPELVRKQDEVARIEVALLAELEHLMARQERVQREADEAEAAQAGADHLQALAEQACARGGLGPLSAYALATGEASRGPQLDEAVAIVGKMKPKAAARVAEQWERSFAATVFARLPPRVTAPIVAAMDAAAAADVTEAMLARLAFPEHAR